jgi:RNA-directed DNA polymerase
VPTVGDRIAQTVAAMVLERQVEPIFHPDSFGYVCPEQEGSSM